MSDLSWLQLDLQGDPSNHTLALVEHLVPQQRQRAAMEEEAEELLINFWMGKVEAHAVPLMTGSTLRLFVAELAPKIAQKVCMRLRKRNPNPVPNCLLRGSTGYSILLGCSKQPDGIENWIIRHIEKKSLSTSV